jgi:pimeloyl-ACP methyl ester carboxylesterase
MSKFPDAVWLNVSPALKGFDRRLLKHLSKQVTIAQWQYCQTLDESISLEKALVLLHDYLKHSDHPLHLLGHSTSGLLGLFYARRYPERVKSLTLLSVGAYPAVDWQAHYYVQRQLLPCSRETVLTQTVYTLFGYQSRPITRELIRILEQDLVSSLSPHTLYQRVNIPPGGVPTPLLVCGSQDDTVIDANLFQGWQPWLKQRHSSSEKCQDRLWQCPKGRYFFHYFYPLEVSEQILNFWGAVALSTGTSPAPVATVNFGS